MSDKQMATILLGCQWGDEGKGKVIDYLANDYQIIARFQGGHNAGHTIYHQGEKIILSLMPSGVINAHTSLYIGPGVVVNPEVLVAEIEMLRQAVDFDASRLAVAAQCPMVLPFHVLADKKQDSSQAIGTTQRGIGPAYEDRFGRRALKLMDLQDLNRFEQRLQHVMTHYTDLLSLTRAEKEQMIAEIMASARQYAPLLTPLLVDGVDYMHQAVTAGKRILCEGAQGAALDIDYGTYPFVTSSSTTAAGVYAGLPLTHQCISEVIGVAKAYVTRVGSGPMPTQADEEHVTCINALANEFGSVTGRARRIGWFDAVNFKRVAHLNGLTSMCITKIDALDDLKEIKVCMGYQLHGKTMTGYPLDADTLDQVEPVYQCLPGWQESTRGCRSWDDLPTNAQRYLEFITEAVGVPLYAVSVGPHREELLILS